MKKHYLAVAALAVALGATACSSGQKAETTTATESTTESAAETSEEDLEEDSFYGTVRAISENQVTLYDETEKVEAVFDVTDAEFSEEVDLEVGDELAVSFLGELAEEGSTKATYVEMLTSKEEETGEAESELTEDLSVYGTIESVEGSSLVLNSEEGTFYFDTTIAFQVTEDGIKAGVEAEVSYYGDADDEEDPAVATRIVTADAADSEDAERFKLTGQVVEVGADNIVVQTMDEDNSLFTFVGSSDIFDGVAAGQTVTVTYEGSLTDRAITAAGLQIG